MLKLWLLLQVRVAYAIHDSRGHGHAVSVVVDFAGHSSGKFNHTLDGEPAANLVRREPANQPAESRNAAALMALCAALLVGYLCFVAAEDSKADGTDDRSLWAAWPRAFQWMVLSMTLSIFNKWIFIQEGAHPFPMTLSCCHLFTTSCFLQLLRCWRPHLFPSLSAGERPKNGRQLAKVVLLVGTLLSMSVLLSNSAAVLLSVAFVNMLKGGNPLLALLLGLALGTSSCTWQMLGPVLMIMLGATATIHGELSLSYWGLGLLVTAILIEQFRLVMFKSLMSDRGFSLDPLSALALFAPCACLGTFVAAVYEWRHAGSAASRMDVMQGSALALNSLVAVTLNIAYSRLLKVSSPLTFTVFGTAKDVATAGLSLVLVGGTVTPQQLLGYGTTLVGMIYYDRVKRSTAG